MRIGTWNVEYAAGLENNARRLQILRSNPADIWVLTETHDDLDLTSTHLPVHSLPRKVRPGSDVREGSRWVTIWSSFPILKPSLLVRDKERTVAALLDTPLGAMIMFGTVLPWHSDRGKHSGGTVVQNWSEQYRVIDEQNEEWCALRRDHPDAVLCVAGDLNLNLGGPHWYGTERGHEAMRKAMHQNGLVCTTEYDRIPPELKLNHSPIDHVLISESLANNSRVVAGWEGTAPDGVRLSDHSGLVVDLDEHNEKR